MSAATLSLSKTVAEARARAHRPRHQVLLLQRTVDVRQDAVQRKEAHRLIQRKPALLDLMQNRQSQRQLED